VVDHPGDEGIALRAFRIKPAKSTNQVGAEFLLDVLAVRFRESVLADELLRLEPNEASGILAQSVDAHLSLLAAGEGLVRVSSLSGEVVSKTERRRCEFADLGDTHNDPRSSASLLSGVIRLSLAGDLDLSGFRDGHPDGQAVLDHQLLDCERPIPVENLE